MDLSLLLLRPVQYAVAQFSSLFGARDIEGWQLPINWGVNYTLLTWFLASHLLFWLLTSTPCLPAFVGVIIITIIVMTSLFASGTACTTCTGAAALACTTPTAASTSTAAGCWLLLWFVPAQSLLRHQWPSFPPSCRLPVPDLPLQRCLRPHTFWALGPAVRASSGSW